MQKQETKTEVKITPASIIAEVEEILKSKKWKKIRGG